MPGVLPTIRNESPSECYSASGQRSALPESRIHADYGIRGDLDRVVRIGSYSALFGMLVPSLTPTRIAFGSRLG